MMFRQVNCSVRQSNGFHLSQGYRPRTVSISVALPKHQLVFGLLNDSHIAWSDCKQMKSVTSCVVQVHEHQQKASRLIGRSHYVDARPSKSTSTLTEQGAPPQSSRTSGQRTHTCVVQYTTAMRFVRPLDREDHLCHCRHPQHYRVHTYILPWSV